MERIGIDAARVAMFFFAPPDREVLWSETNVKGSTRFLERIYAEGMASAKIEEKKFDSAGLAGDELAIYKTINKTIKQVTGDCEQMGYNTAVARMMEFMNLYANSGAKESVVARFAMERLTQLLAPFAPFIAEELWEAFGHSDSVFCSSWPDYDKKAIEEEMITIPIQVNGKLRARMETAKDTPEEIIVKQSGYFVESYLEGKNYRYVYVPNRLINYIVGEKLPPDSST